MATATSKQANITPEDLKHITCLIPQMNLNTTDKDEIRYTERLLDYLKVKYNAIR